MRFSVQTVIWSFVLIAGLLVGFLALRTKPIEVETAKVSVGDLRLTVQEDGITRIREKYIVSTPVAGRLSRIELKPGDVIKEVDQRMAVIFPAQPAMLDARSKAQAESQVEQAQAAVKRAEANAAQIHVDFELAKSKFERAQKLRNTRAISQEEYDVARSQFLSLTQSIRTTAFDEEIAAYELQTAQAALLQFSDDETAGQPFEVFAPIGGSVLRVFQESATVVDMGMPLVELGDPNNLEMVIDVLSTDAVQIEPGSHLQVKHWGGDYALAGTVRIVEPAAFTKISSLGVEEQRVNVIADFDEPQDRLRTIGDGFRIEVEITTAELQDVLQVPSSALFRFQREWHVFAIQDRRAVLRQVEIGAQNDARTVILSGLRKDEEVILYPSDSISDQSPIIQVSSIQP